MFIVIQNYSELFIVIHNSLSVMTTYLKLMMFMMLMCIIRWSDIDLEAAAKGHFNGKTR